METQVPTKSLNSKDTHHKFSGTAYAMGTFLKTESSNLLENPEKNDSGADVGPRLASEKLRRMFGSKRRDSASSTNIDRRNRRLRHELLTE